MPTLNIVRETKVMESFRTQQVRGMFSYDAPSIKQEWTCSLPIESKPWTIGLIVGPSGSGKTTLAKEAFGGFKIHDSFEWSATKAVVDEFPKEADTKDIVQMFNAVGFSSPPHWLKPFGHLSNGQKFRVELARCLIEKNNGLVFDEFTSVVDRDAARIGCAAVSKAIRSKERPPFVAVSCHYDIIDWLDPDWVFDVGTQVFEWRLRRRFPEIILNICETTTAAWKAFRSHHYLDHGLHKAAQCFVATWEEKPVAFCSVIHFPHASTKLFKREHRTVVMPDFQGVGIGNRLSEFVAANYTRRGFRFISTTSAPSMIHHRNKSPLWRCHRFGQNSPLSRSSNVTGIRASVSSKRITAGFEFIGK
jgi:ABC-type lipoprotein export system ATPase subunit/GNAT superfamily N-acetyltransferase